MKSETLSLKAIITELDFLRKTVINYSMKLLTKKRFIVTRKQTNRNNT